MRFYDEEIAIKYGIEAGVLYQHFLFWIKNNKANGRNYKEGRFWTYNSRSALLTQFPELTENKIRGALNRLVEAGILMRGCFNKFAWDRTTWFAFVEEPKELAEQPAGTIRDEDGNVIQNANVNSTKCSVIITDESVIKTDESVIETSVIGYNNQTIPYINPDNETDSNPSGGDKSVEMNNQPPAAAPSLEDVDYENFCKDYLDYFAKITARTYSDINLLLKKEIDRQDFKTMFENALFLKKSGYHWRKGMELIYKDLGDAETPMHAYFNFRDELRLLLRDDAELVRARVNKSKKQTLKNEDDKLEQFKSEEERQEFEAWLRESFKDSNYDYDDVSRQIENARKKIGEDDKQALFKKLGDMYKLE